MHTKLRDNLGNLFSEGEKLWNGNLDQEKFQHTLQVFIDYYSKTKATSEGRNLVSYSLRKFFPNQVNKLKASEIPPMQDLLKNPLIRRVNAGISILNNEVNVFFLSKTHPTNYLKLELVDDDLGDFILQLSTRELASKADNYLEKKFGPDTNRVITPFTDERDNKPGVWMSISGKQLDFSKISTDS